MTREEFEYAIMACGCFIYRGQTYYEESELRKAFEDLGLIEQEPKTGHWIKTDEEHGKCCHCGRPIDLMDSWSINYCSNCGSYNGGDDNG